MADPNATYPFGTIGRIALSSQDAIIAALPHLLGFPPHNSAVLVGINENSGGQESIRLTQRFDLPSKFLTPVERTELASAVTRPMARSGATSVILAVFTDESKADLDVLPAQELVDELVLALDDRGLWVRDMLYTDGVSHWSYGWDTQTHGPQQGVAIPEELRTMIAAEFAGAGAAMVGSRQALFAEISPHMSSVDEVASVLQRIEAQRADLELWRDEAIEHITASASAAFFLPESKAWMLSGLQDVRVRDTFLWDMAQPGADRPSAIAALTGVLRSAPEGYVAPVATVLAIQHWSSGDGARANACLDRATADDPNYSLAALANTAISNGLPPTTWPDMMGALNRDECRHGMATAVSATPPSLAASTPAISLPHTSPGLAR